MKRNIATGKFIGINLAKRRFGRLRVISKVGVSRQGTLWKCRCACGSICIIPARYLLGGTRSCGCYRAEKVSKARVNDLTGKRFGRLIVIGRSKLRKKNRCFWSCVCDCGNKCDVRTDSLVGKTTKSCGCLLVEHALNNIERHKPTSVSKSCALFLDILENEFNLTIIREIYLDRRIFDGEVGNILIEVDNKYWHRNTQTNDFMKDQIALRNGFAIVRVDVDDIQDVRKKFIYYRSSFEKLFRLKGLLV